MSRPSARYDAKIPAKPVTVFITVGLHRVVTHRLSTVEARSLIAELEDALAGVIESHETRIPRERIKAGGTD